MITFNQVRAAAKEIVTANPDTTNPRSDSPVNMCLYRGPKGSTCLGGAVLRHFGAELPPEGDSVDSTPNHEQFTQRALSWLRVLQIKADSHPDTKWRYALENANASWRGMSDFQKDHMY